MPITELIREWGSRLKHARESGRQLLFGFDFDGTLAPLVDHPDNARIPESTLSALVHLRHCPNVNMLIVSGRELQDLQRLIPIGFDIAALCGLQFLIEDIVSLSPRCDEFERLFSFVVQRLRPLTGELPGAWLESKRYAATIHLRQCDPTRKIRAAGLVEAALRDLWNEVRVLDGPASIELFPRHGTNKGDAMARYHASLGSSATFVDYFGDADNDIPAWDYVQPFGGTGWIVGRTLTRKGLEHLDSPQHLSEVIQFLADTLD